MILLLKLSLEELHDYITNFTILSNQECFLCNLQIEACLKVQFVDSLKHASD